MARPSAEPPQGTDDLAALPSVHNLSGWQRLWQPFWVVPTVICILAVVAGLGLPELDRRFGRQLPYLFQGGPDGARNLLGTIAGAMISVTGLVFSVTLVALQLASSQFTPRVLQEFLDSRVVQITLGIFAASFIFALTVLRTVRGDFLGSEPFVPQLGVSVAFLLVLASVAMFLVFIHHITTTIQVGRLISDIGDDTVQVVERYFPPSRTAAPRALWTAPDAQTQVTVSAEGHGFLGQVRHRRLVELAEERDLVVELLVEVGRFVPGGVDVARVWGTIAEDDVDEVARQVLGCLDLAHDRTTHQDPAFGVRKLVDIAERALSPGINDPTTAVQVLDELHRILRSVVSRPDPPAVVTLAGEPRLVHRPQRVEALVDLALEEILHYGRESVQVPRRVQAMVADLRQVALPDHQDRLAHWETVAERLVRPPGAEQV